MIKFCSRHFSKAVQYLMVAVVVWLMIVACALRAVGNAPSFAQSDPLPSWNQGTAKQSIITFVRRVTDQDSTQYVPPEKRIATFDQDGTLWVEHPLYTQAMFALDRLKSLAPQHPEWKTQEPFKAILEGDREAMTKFSEGDLVQIIAATHAGMTTEAFIQLVKDWLATAKHPRFQHLYTELIYQPMREVMQYLRSNGFKTYIVSFPRLRYEERFAKVVGFL